MPRSPLEQDALPNQRPASDSAREDAPGVVGIRGPRVALVPLEAERHLDNYVRWFNDPEVTRYLSMNLPLSRVAERAFFERVESSPPSNILWAIHDEAGRHIGGTGLHRIDWLNRAAISGIVIGAKDAWGRGYGSEVMRVRTRWAFEELGLKRIESECFVENVGSATCLERAGYRRIGTARAKHWRAGRWHDALLWEILDDDWRAAQAAAG